MESSSAGSHIQIVVNFKHNVSFALNEDAKLSELKNLIEKEFMIKEEEYEVFIKDTQLLIINQDLKISSLIQSYQSNEFTVKAYKNVFDLKQQLVEFNDFLEYQINKNINKINHEKDLLESLEKSLKV